MPMARPAPPDTDSLPVDVKKSHAEITGVLQLPQTLRKELLKDKNQTVAPSASPVQGTLQSVLTSPLGFCYVCLEQKRLFNGAKQLGRGGCLFPLKDRDVCSQSEAFSRGNSPFQKSELQLILVTAVFPFRKPGAHGCGMIPPPPSSVILGLFVLFIALLDSNGSSGVLQPLTLRLYSHP